MKQKKWNVGNSYRYIDTAAKIRFNFQFPRLPDAAYVILDGYEIRSQNLAAE